MLGIENGQAFAKLKDNGVGQTTLLKFLGGNWKQWRIQEALSPPDSFPGAWKGPPRRTAPNPAKNPNETQEMVSGFWLMSLTYVGCTTCALPARGHQKRGLLFGVRVPCGPSHRRDFVGWAGSWDLNSLRAPERLASQRLCLPTEQAQTGNLAWQVIWQDNGPTW